MPTIFDVDYLTREVFQYLTPGEKLKATRASRFFKTQLENELLWKNTGADNYADFVARTKVLPPGLQRKVLNREAQLPQLKSWQSLFEEDKKELLIQQGHITKEQLETMKGREYDSIIGLQILISGKVLTVRQAINLSDKLFLNLINAEQLQHLICGGYLKIEDINELSDREYNNLNRPGMYTLIVGLGLSIDKAKSISEAHFDCLREAFIQRLFWWNKLTIEETQGLVSIHNFRGQKKTIFNFNFEQLKDLEALLLDDFISFGEIKELINDEYDNLKDKDIQKLILNNKLTIDQAKVLTLEERLALFPFIELILKGFLTYNEFKALKGDELKNLSEVGITHMILDEKLSFADAITLSDAEIKLVSENYWNIITGEVQVSEVLTFASATPIVRFGG